MTGPELNYDIHDKKLLAIVEALREWRVYLGRDKVSRPNLYRPQKPTILD